MGASSSSLLDDTKCNYIRGRTEAELKNFSPHYKRQYCVAFFSQLRDEVEQQQTIHTQLLKQKDPPQPSELLYKDNVLHYDDSRKWKERFVVVRANYSLELYDNQEAFVKGNSPRTTLQLTGGTVMTTEEKYCALVDKAFPDLNSSKEETASHVVSSPGPFPVYLSLPYRKDSYFSFQEEDKQIRFISILSDCIRHQNHDCLKKSSCDGQAFMKAIHFYRQEKGHYESWEMLVGTDCQVLSNLVMEELLPSLQTELLPRLKGKKADRKRVWFVTVEATYQLVQEQLSDGLQRLKEECSEAAKQQEALIRSDMDQIINSRNFMETKLQGLVSEPAQKFCLESVSPYLASILEELMGPVSSGFQAVRQRLEAELSRICTDFRTQETKEELTKALEELSKAQLEDCYQYVSVLKEQLQELRSRFKFSNSTLVVHKTQSHMQQLMENAVYTFEKLLNAAIKDKPEEQTSVMEKAKLRVLKQYDYDSSTVRKRIFQEALVDITLPAIRRNLAPTCKTELQKYEQYVFADYTNFIQVENVYEDILLSTLNNEVNKVVKEAATLKKHNLFVDSTDLQCISQSSLIDSRTPPRSTPSSPAKVLASTAALQKAEQNLACLKIGNGLEDQAVQENQAVPQNLPPNDVESSEQVAAAPEMSSQLLVTSQKVTSMSTVTPAVVLSPVTPDSTLPKAADTENVPAEATSTIRITESVLLTDEEKITETQSISSSDKNTTDVSPSDQPEICEAQSELLIKPQIGTVQLVTEDTDAPNDNLSSSSTTPPDIIMPKMDCSTPENTNGLPHVPDISEADIPLKSADEESTPDTAICSDSGKEVLDNVKAIRDLVVEIIEVEDIISPCPSSEAP